MRTGIDWHAFVGIFGTSSAVVLQNFNTIAAGSAALATACYMLLRVAREWRSIKRESEDRNGPTCQNFAPVKKQKENEEEN